MPLQKYIELAFWVKIYEWQFRAEINKKKQLLLYKEK